LNKDTLYYNFNIENGKKCKYYVKNTKGNRMTEEKKRNIEFYDLHIHTEWSDGDDSVEDVIKTADEKGLRAIGICEHLSEIKPSIPFEEKELEIYLSEIKVSVKKHPNVKVFKGLEINTFPLENLEIDTNLLENFDFLLFEDVTKLMTLKKFSNWVKEYYTKQKSPIIGISHPNLGWPAQLAGKIVEFVSSANIFLEFNANYTSNYEGGRNTTIYENLKNSKVNFTIGSDSHSCSTIGNFNYAIEFLEGLGFSPIEDRLPELFKIKL